MTSENTVENMEQPGAGDGEDYESFSGFLAADDSNYVTNINPNNNNHGTSSEEEVDDPGLQHFLDRLKRESLTNLGSAAKSIGQQHDTSTDPPGSMPPSSTHDTATPSVPVLHATLVGNDTVYSATVLQNVHMARWR